MADDGYEKPSPSRHRRKKASKDAAPETVDSSDIDTSSPRLLLINPRTSSRSPPVRGSPSPRTRHRAGEPERRFTIDSDPGADLHEDILLVETIESDSELLSLPQEVLIRVLEMVEPLPLALTGASCRYLRSIAQMAWMKLTKDKHSKVRHESVYCCCFDLVLWT